MEGGAGGHRGYPHYIGIGRLFRVNLGCKLDIAKPPCRETRGLIRMANY